MGEGSLGELTESLTSSGGSVKVLHGEERRGSSLLSNQTDRD